MQCNHCGAPLPTGAASCPACGHPTPYNTSGQAAYDPAGTMPSYQEGTPPPPPSPVTNYGLSGGFPYSPAPTDPYSPPPPPGPYAPGAQPPYGPPATAPRQSNLGKVLLITGAILLVVIAACCGGFFLLTRSASQTLSLVDATATSSAATASAENATARSLLTPTPTPTSSPSGSPIAASAAAIITKVQMADQVNDVIPTHLTTTFKTGQVIYATFEIKKGSSGYAQAKWYLDYTKVLNSKILQIQANYDAGYFAARYRLAGQGTVEIYWCSTSDCSDAQLAQVATFSVE
uniref:Zinc-ribbon domain-containing protein n=1 Tax=Thermogemmatispora argillosa TaxID=2045280 RepID=A0A455T5Q3_9CHLR|nr:hypothetical protein KTA_29380 [Thermogemmatispora argillosa]